MAAPTLPTTSSGNSIPASIAANDLLIFVMYVEPANEASSTASYAPSSGSGIAVPSGWTMWPSISPVASNDANITSQNTNRMYIAYKWATGSESGSVTWSSNGTAIGSTGTQADGVYADYNGIMAVRGTTDTTGGTSGTPNYLQTTAVNGVTSKTALPAVSLAGIPSNTLMLYAATTWDNVQASTPSGWSTTARNSGTASTFTETLSSGGSVLALAPTLASSTTNPNAVWMVALTPIGSTSTNLFFF